VKKLSTEFKIQFVGLKLGTHRYAYDLNKSFFEGIEGSLVENGNVHVDVTLDKKETMMIVNFAFTGEVNAQCDRCNDPIVLPIQKEYRIVYKFGTEISDDENLIVLDNDAFEIELAQPMYELIVISLPTRFLHEQGTCNEAMMELYQSYIVNANEPDMEDFDEEWDDEDEEWDEDSSDEENEEMDLSDNDKPIDPRWSALNKLK
jgi:uncharacterized metal-binding protein YceD (DUF177 family)